MDSSTSEWNSATMFFPQLSYLMFQAVSSQAQMDFSSSLRNFHAAHQMLVAHMKEEDKENGKRERTEAQAAYEKAKSLIESRNVSYDLVVKALDNYNFILRVVMRRRRMDIPRGFNPGSSLLSGGTEEDD